MLIQPLPDLFCAVGRFFPFLEQVCESGEVKIIDKHALILHYVTAGEPTYGIIRLISHLHWRTVQVLRGGALPDDTCTALRSLAPPARAGVLQCRWAIPCH